MGSALLDDRGLGTSVGAAGPGPADAAHHSAISFFRVSWTCSCLAIFSTHDEPASRPSCIPSSGLYASMMSLALSKE